MITQHSYPLSLIFKVIRLIPLFVGTLLYTSPIDSDVKNELILWNVGQGQWLTLVQKQSCYHFDSGGEFVHWTLLTRLCGHKQNLFLLSHWDWDHIGFLNKGRYHLPKACLLKPPLGPNQQRSKQRLIESLPLCPHQELSLNKQDSLFQELHFSKASIKKLKPNDWSRVFLVAHLLLSPGDSTTKMEKLWIPKIPKKISVRYLILGHHGSHTSTSDSLLTHLPSLYGALVSHRKKRYGHPHPKVVQKLKKYQVPLLSTEDWGTIRLEM